MNISERIKKQEAKSNMEERLLEWVTRKDADEPAPSNVTDEQIRELESLEKTWNWFGSLLENASDDDFRPTASVASPTTVEKTPKPLLKRYRFLYALCMSIAVVAIICGFWVNNRQVQPSASQTPIAKNLPADIINQPVVENNSNITSSPRENLAWEEEDAYDNELETLSNSILNAAQGGTWEMSAMAECSVVGYGMSAWSNDGSSF